MKTTSSELLAKIRQTLSSPDWEQSTEGGKYALNAIQDHLTKVSGIIVPQDRVDLIVYGMANSVAVIFDENPEMLLQNLIWEFNTITWTGSDQEWDTLIDQVVALLQVEELTLEQSMYPDQEE